MLRQQRRGKSKAFTKAWERERGEPTTQTAVFISLTEAPDGIR